jgi:RimJ/RimL family protein N-acetyltransferase
VLLWVIALVASAYALHRLALWLESRGWLYYRHRRSGVSLGVALGAAIDPRIRQLLEAKQAERRLEEDESGDDITRRLGETPQLRLPLEPIVTQRLLIRPLESSDLEAAFELNSDADARRYTGGVVDRAASDRGLRAQIARVRASGLGSRAVVDRGSGDVVGYCGLQPFADSDEIELFYGYASRVWGRGLATEAARAVLELGFRCLDRDRIVAIVDPENRASVRVLEKLGFVRTGTYPHPRWHVDHLLLAVEQPGANADTVR